MYFVDFNLIKAAQELRVEKALDQLKEEQLLRQARPVRRGWLSRQRCRLLVQLGHRLMTIGRKLERYGLPQSLPLEREVRGTP